MLLLVVYFTLSISHFSFCAISSAFSDAKNLVGNEILSKHPHTAQIQSSLNDYTSQLLDKCVARNGTEALEEIQNSITELNSCVSSRINVMNISEEIKAAIPRGALDEVFSKYCDQIPEVKECRIPVIAALKVCLSDEADNDLDILDATIDAALDFICYKGGERIAIFMAENGTDCFLKNVDNIADCVNETLPDLESALTEMQTTNTSFFDEKNCHLEMKVKECFVASLKDCHDPTPANVVEGLINAMIRKTPCYKSIAGMTSVPAPLLLISVLLSWVRLFIHF